MTSMANLLTFSAPPSALAIISAIKADVRRFTDALADKHARRKEGEWPETSQRICGDSLRIAAAADILADHLSPDEMRVVTAVLRCRRVSWATVDGVPHDYETPAAEVVEAAQSLADQTRSDCQVHMGEVA